MKEIRVRGRFLTPDHQPMEGTIEFVPELIWVEEGETTYPTLAPCVDLVDGRFDVTLTETHSETYGDWVYQVISPLGVWNIPVHGNSEQLLRDLLPDHFIQRD